MRSDNWLSLQEGHDFAEGVNAVLGKEKKKANWQPASLAEVDDARIKFQYFDSASKLRLNLDGRKDYKEYPHRKYMLPSEEEIKAVVTGEVPSVGQYALNEKEVVDFFLRERNNKQGVQQKVTEVLQRKTKVISKDEHDSLKWQY